MRTSLRALGYFWPERLKISLLVVIILLGTLVGLLQVWPMIVLVDSVATTEPKGGAIHRVLLAMLPGNPRGQIIGLALMTLLLRLASDLLSRARTLLSFRIGYNGLVRIRCDLYRKLQALSIAFHRTRPQGDVIYRLTNDTFGYQTVLNVLIDLAIACVMLCVMIAVLLSRNVSLTLLALSVAPLLLLANVWYGRILQHHTTAAKQLECEFTTTLQRGIVAMGLVQAFGREDDEFARFHATVRNSVGAWLKLHWQEVCYGLTVSVIFGAGGALVFGYGGYLVYRDMFLTPQGDGMVVGDLILFMGYLGMLYDPLCKLSGSGAGLQSGLAGVARVFEMLDQPLDIVDKVDAEPLACRSRTLHLEHVGFQYEQGPRVLHGVDVVIEPGQMVAFVGSSGVGKSTLLNLLPRFYDTTQGALKMDGRDVRDVKLRDLRRHVALVLQDNIVLPTTIAENIAYGRPSATPAEIRKAAAMAGANAFIEKLPDQYQTKVSEGGQNLSGGQRQRIAIARALLTEAPFLVLDEPTSALDPLNERLITETLRRLKGDRTIILVTHRLSSVVHCDQIFVLDQGRVVQRGTHEQLLAGGGLYPQMARDQGQAAEFALIAGAA